VRLKRSVVPGPDVCSTAEEVHQAVEGHKTLKVDLVTMMIFQGIGSFADMLVLLVGYRREGASRLYEE